MAKITTTLSSSGTKVHNELNGLNEGDYLHLTQAEKDSFAIDSNVVHISGKETIIDTKTFANGIITNYEQFDTTLAQTNAVGKLKWNDVDGTLELGLKGGNVTLQLGQEQIIRVVNKTSSNLTEAGYEAVYISGAQGQRLKVDLALANSDLTSIGTLGIVTENISVNQEGFVTSNGLVRGINTTGSLQGETWHDGDVLYLSPLVAGRLTNIEPIAPQHTVHMGICVHAHQTQGTIFVKVTNGYEIEELHNVLISLLSNNDGLFYDSVSKLWKNKSITTVLGYIPENLANKQNSLTVDGTGTKYPTIDILNNAISTINTSIDNFKDKNYIHYQISTSNTWIVVHNLKKYPSVSVVDSGNNLVIGDCIYNSIDQLTITFTASFSGKAYIN